MTITSIWQAEHLKLRSMIPTDLALFGSFDEDIERQVDMLHFPQSRERMKNWFDKELSRERDDDSFRWIAENMDGEAVGTIDTFACNPRFGTFKYGIAIAPKYQGKGYGREMILLVLGYYFHELRYQKVTPHVYSFNQASIKLHERMGFTREGCLRNMVYSQGEYFDEIHFGMTRDEFGALYKVGS